MAFRPFPYVLLLPDRYRKALFICCSIKYPKIIAADHLLYSERNITLEMKPNLNSLFVTAISIVLVFCLPEILFANLDTNSNGLSDVWELIYGANGLTPTGDTDGDGFTNLEESIAATDPLSPLSYPQLTFEFDGALLSLSWATALGKNYQLISDDSLAIPSTQWPVVATTVGNGSSQSFSTPVNGSQRFFRLQIKDQDTDLDGLSDWEELAIGFDPKSKHTERYDSEDGQRVSASWDAPSTITVAALDDTMSERWPDPGVIAIRRSGGMKPLTVSITLSGTATLNTDYTASATTTVNIPAGSREVWVEFMPIADSDDNESSETATLTVNSSPDYTIGASSSANISLLNEPASALPNAKAAARFLVQAAFGPDQDSSADADIIPENVEEVMSLGFEGWIDNQFNLPETYLEPFTAYATANNIPGMSDHKLAAWWSRAMGVSPAVPGGPAVAYDVLRQRIAFCLSQILVVSDRPETLGVQQVGMANYYDLFIKHAFGNYRDLLFDVTRHPVMGFYLSSLKNQKADPANNLFPDENYAREVMQLFSIGLWELNTNGTRKKNAQNEDIPTYTNADITSFARVFTGMTFAGSNAFLNAQENWTQPMEMWDDYHDLDPKVLLKGTVLPARTASPGKTGTAVLADLNGAIDNLFNHPNVGPFISRQLIQRLVTSNPSPDYVERVATKFNDNGSGVRGDLKAVIKAILLDPEARDPAKRLDPHFGKQREPFLRVVNLARAFNASSPSGYYRLTSFFMDHYEEPMKAPSVFNFYLPNYTPPGEIQSLDLVAPEFQILNATSAISAPNYYNNAILGGLNRWGVADPAHKVSLDFTQELPLVSNDIDTLLRRLDLVLTCGELRPRQYQLIREAMLRITGNETSDWQNERLRLAIYLIVTSPEFCILR